jgi:flagellar FliJ protein
MKWAASLIRITSHEVETLQKRLAEIVDRRELTLMRQAVITAEGEAEIERARLDPTMGWQMGAYREGLKQRLNAIQLELSLIRAEEAGARDALGEAFETLKKYESVAESARVARAAELGRRETASMDEMGLRRSYLK